MRIKYLSLTPTFYPPQVSNSSTPTVPGFQTPGALRPLAPAFSLIPSACPVFISFLEARAHDPLNQ